MRLRAAFLCLAIVCLAMTPAELQRLARQRGAFDAQHDRAAESSEGLNVLFGRDAERAGVSMLSVKEAYESAYAAATAQKPWWKKLPAGTPWFILLITIAGAAVKKLFGEAIEIGCQAALRSVRAKAIGAEGVERDDHQVQLVTRCSHDEKAARARRHGAHKQRARQDACHATWLFGHEKGPGD